MPCDVDRMQVPNSFGSLKQCKAEISPVRSNNKLSYTGLAFFSTWNMISSPFLVHSKFQVLSSLVHFLYKNCTLAQYLQVACHIKVKLNNVWMTFVLPFSCPLGYSCIIDLTGFLHQMASLTKTVFFRRLCILVTKVVPNAINGKF